MLRKSCVFLVCTVALIFNIIPCSGHHSYSHSNYDLIRNRRQTNKCSRQFPCDNNNECIHYKKVCNGEIDCTDGSDEDPAFCNESILSNDTFCPIVKIENGQIKVLGQGYVPGTPIPNYAFINIICNKGYKLIPTTNLVGCINGAWSLPLPECKETCSPRFSTDLMDVACLFDDKPVNCGEPLLDGTVAISRCKNRNKDYLISLCSKGSWDTPLIQCQTECGKASPDSSKGIQSSANGGNVKTGKFPWHVGIYRLRNNDYTYQCGGAMISPLIILSVGHCFTDNSGKPNNPEEYFIGAGKYYSDYKKTEALAQKRQVKEIHIPSQFKGFQSDFSGDVAVVIVKSPFQTTDAVSPVCLDWNVNQFKPNSSGNVAGWLHPEMTDELKILQVPYIDGQQCANEVSTHFKKFVTFDKFCSGSTNGSEICRGSSGSGIYFETGQKYYIRGVLSLADVLNSTCSRSHGLYTDLIAYRSFIQGVVERNPITDKAIRLAIKCPPRTSNSLTINCTLSGEPVDCTKPVADGTVAISKCKNFFISSQGEQSISISTCSGGSWDKPLIKCTPECGEVVPDGEIYVTEGVKAQRAKFPWHVGIYHYDNVRGERYQCGGSIITPSIVISVAHCFLDHEGKDRYPAEQYYVTAGKFLSNINITEEFGQYSQVYKYYVPSIYKGFKTNLIGDLAVVELKYPFEMSNVVRPACIDWNDSTNIKPNDTGVLVGWTFNEAGNISEGLSQVPIPYIDTRTCLQFVPPNFQSFVTNDKLCAGYTNGTGSGAICKGDSGNGLIFEKNVNNKEKYYIGGIASVSPVQPNDNCNPYALYTKVSSYLDFIRESISRSQENKATCLLRISDSVDVRCTLDGKLIDCWQAVDGTIAITTCKDSYKPTIHRNISVSRCSEGFWDKPFIQCVQVQPLQTGTCPPRKSDSVNIKCISDDKTVDCNTPLTEGTVVISECKDLYVPVYGDIPISVSRCSKGLWNNPLIQCKPLQRLNLECGEVSPDGDIYAVNAHAAKRAEFPWHIALYRLLKDEHSYKCGGSIITPSIIITAAHCFTNQYGVQYPAEEFYVGAGKYYSDYNAKEDVQAQKRQVKEYRTPPIYRGYETNFQGDLAVAVLIQSLEMTNVVHPVCIEWDNKIEKQQLRPTNRGSVVGWGTINPYDASKPSEELKQLTAPFIDVKKCLDNVPKNFRRWVTTDKFCAGYTNGSSVCKGDSGGGMVFEWTVENKQKYYIRGVVSVGPQDKQKSLVCDNYKYGAYTRVSAYSSFILNIINEIQDKEI